MNTVVPEQRSPDRSKRPRWSHKLDRKTALLVAVGTIAAIALNLFILSKLPIVKLPSLLDHSAGVQIFDRFDKPVCTVQERENRQPVPIDRISKHVRNALLAAEDRNFYYHFGVDPFGILRASLKNWKAGRFIEGGSTITQQLVKQLYLDPNDKTLWRKVKEAAMSFDVNLCYSKNKVLETYLNEVYFGNGAYGVERAAAAYFNKDASKLTLPEAAYLIGLVRAPSTLSLAAHRARALERQRQVLDGMVECGYISNEEADRAQKQKLIFREGPHPMRHPYYVSRVLDLLAEQVGEDEMWKRPFSVYTNLDPAAQKAAEEILQSRVKKAPRGVEQGALVSINVADGTVVAVVGGVGRYEKHQWNRALYPHTAGSAFKPFVYLAGLIKGSIQPNSMITDAPITVTNTDGTQYQPKNFDNQFMGQITVRDALTYSRNICAIMTAEQAGINNVIKTARAAGITAQMDPYPSLALGACAVSPLEMAVAYGTLARSGVYIAPQFIRRIDCKEKSMNRVVQTKAVSKLPAEPVRQIVDVMQDVVQRGTGRAANISGLPIAGKTGTADQSRDIWFIGFTPDVVTAVWAGNDENRPVPGSHVTGGSIMAGLWRDYMVSYYRYHPRPTLAFTPPQAPLTRQAVYEDESNFGLTELVDGIARPVETAAGGVTDFVGSIVSGAADAITGGGQPQPAPRVVAPPFAPARARYNAPAAPISAAASSASQEKHVKKNKHHKGIWGKFVHKIKDIF